MERFLVWFQIAQFIVMAIVGLLVWTASRAFRAGQWTHGIDKSGKIAEIEKRLDKMGIESSRLASYVQGLPDTLRGRFVDIEVFKARLDASQQDREFLHAQVRELWARLRGVE